MERKNRFYSQTQKRESSKLQKFFTDMAELFIKQSKQYADGRPSYPPQLFDFIASKMPAHDLAWDAGTGTGQAAQSLAGLYTTVIATDTSPKQLDFAPKLPNILYRRTPPSISAAELHHLVAPESTVDLVTVAQALHWFDLPTFYSNVRHVLKKPHGVIAAWCYSLPEISEPVDAALRRLYAALEPYWEAPRRLVDEEYRTIEFPFEAVEGEGETGPFEGFAAEKTVEFEEYLTYLRSWSAYQTAKEKGVEFLSGEVVKEFQEAWNEGGEGKKVARFPIFLRIGRVGLGNK